MNRRIMLRIILAVVVMGGASVFFTNQEEELSPEKEVVVQRAVYLAMTQAHLQPINIDDNFSSDVFNDFIEVLDGRKRFFVQPDIDKMIMYRDQIDDQFKASDLTFFDDIVALVDLNIMECKNYYEDILSTPFDFTIAEKIETDYDKEGFAQDKTELKERWRKRLKYYTLQELEGRITAQKTVSTDSLKTMKELEELSREDIKTAYDRWYENYESVRRSDRFELYLNVITRQFDPHSAYFSPKGKQDFNMRMGGKLEGIGAQLTTEGEFTKVVSVVPGGPVWKDDRIEVNDLILKVAQDGEQAVDITGMRVDDVVTLIRGPKGTLVTLTVQKKDESQVEIEILRDVINLEIARARGAMLHQEDTNERFGYIDLPMFYNSFDGPEGNSSAKDVATLIDTLKSQNMDGLIIDLRDNLGGALVDAIDISGLFIEEGPVVQVKSKDRRPYIHKDNNSNVSYDGPLIVLINNFSASASEIVAGALQDYGRAVIVGSQSFGKGSVQNFIDLDRAIRNNDDVKPLGEIKLTIQKYYRVNGASTQLRGVEPDIKLPDTYDLIPTGERENDQALPWSRIEGVSYSQNVLSYDGTEMLKNKSTQRIDASEAFSLIEENAQWLQDNKNNTSYSLNIDDYQAYLEEMEGRNERYDSILDNTIDGLSINQISLEFESEITEEDKQARAEAWQEGVSKDFYLTEAMAIMNDILVSDGYVDASKRKIKE